MTFYKHVRNVTGWDFHTNNSQVAVNEKYEDDVLACDDELNELVLRVMLGCVWAFDVLVAMDEKRLELIVHRFMYADCDKHNFGDNGSKEQ